MDFTYKTHGVCSKEIKFDITDDKVYNVVFQGGCDGNLKGIGALVNGMTVSDVITKLKGTGCGPKTTSCPDQLAIALENAL